MDFPIAPSSETTYKSKPFTGLKGSDIGKPIIWKGDSVTDVYYKRRKVSEDLSSTTELDLHSRSIVGATPDYCEGTKGEDEEESKSQDELEPEVESVGIPGTSIKSGIYGATNQFEARLLSSNADLCKTSKRRPHGAKHISAASMDSKQSFDTNAYETTNCQRRFKGPSVRKRSFDDNRSTTATPQLMNLELNTHRYARIQHQPGTNCTDAVTRYAAHLTEFERCEVLTFPNIFYMGPLSRLPLSCIRRPSLELLESLPATTPVWSPNDILQMRKHFSDNIGDYRFALLGHHLGYRYEMLRCVGCGSFGKVMECLDHKTGKHMAVKVIKNQDRFLIQARYEMLVLQRINKYIFSRLGRCIESTNATQDGRSLPNETKRNNGRGPSRKSTSQNDVAEDTEGSQCTTKTPQQEKRLENTNGQTRYNWVIDPESIPLVQMKNAMFFRGHVLFVFDMMAMNLFELISHNKHLGFSLPLVRRIGRQIFDGLSLLERCGIIHCDLKPENIMLCDPSKSDRVKIIDFGSSCTNSTKVHTYIQSRFYRAPEVMLKLSYSGAIDVWSAACTLVELYTGSPLFSGKSEKDQLARIAEVMGTPSKELLARSKVGDSYFDEKCEPTPAPATKTSEARGVPYNFELEKTDLMAKLVPRATFRAPLVSEPSPTLPGPRVPLLGELEAFEEMLRGCLEWDPEKRLSPQEVLKCGFFTENFGGATPEESMLHDATVCWEEITRCLSNSGSTIV